MHRFLAFAFALGMAAQASAADVDPLDRHQLLELARSMDHAWTAGDANANAQLFAADATARFATESLGVGRDSIRHQFQAFFKDRPAGLRHVTTIERIELLAPGLAMWDAEVRVERQAVAGNWDILTRIRNVTIAAREEDGWRIQAVRAFPLIR